MPACQVLVRTLPGLQMAALKLIPTCGAGRGRERERVHVSSSYGGTNLIVRAPPLLLCLNLIPKDSIPNTIILSVRVSAYESVCVSVGVEGGDTVQSKAQK